MSKPLVYLDGTNLHYENGVLLGEVFALEDGFYHFWPLEKSWHGAWSAHALRAIADLLDAKNAPWEAEIAQHFAAILGQKKEL